MKLVLVDPDDVGGIEEKANRVRRVRTPEGVRKYGQPIGTVITRDSIERAKRRAAGKPGAAKKPSAPSKPAPGKRTTEDVGGISRVEAAERMYGTGSRQHREAQRRWPDGGPKTPVAGKPTKTPKAPDTRFDAETVVPAQVREQHRQRITDRLVEGDERYNQAIDLFQDDIVTDEEVDDEKAAAADRAQQRLAANQETLERVTKDAEVFIQVRPDVIPAILGSGRFKNTHDEDTHGNRTVDRAERAASAEDREEFERATFGESRPVYGYLSARPGGASSPRPDDAVGGDDTRGVTRDYGDAAIKLKRDRVAGRTTFTVGDSFGDQDVVAPVPLNNPSWEAAGTDDISAAKNVDELVPLSGASYVEAQIHGDVTVDDIESVTFAERPLDDAVMDALDKAGIPWSVDGEPDRLQSGEGSNDDSDIATVEDVRAGDLVAGDRIVIDGRAAQVEDVTEDGRDTVIDVTYDDGGTDSIYADPDEIIPRIAGGPAPAPERREITAGEFRVGDRFEAYDGKVYEVTGVADYPAAEEVIEIRMVDSEGKEQTLPFGRDAKITLLPPEGTEDPEPDPEPDPDPVVEEVSVSAAEIKAGDQIADTDGDPLTVIAVRKNRSTGLYDIATIDRDGKKDTNSFSAAVSLARTREALEPDELPGDVATGRPALATYQRRNLAILDLDHNEDLPNNVRQAAARIRLRQPITPEQSRALSDHLSGLAAAETNPRKQRSMARLAASVSAVDAQVNGGEISVVRQAGKMDKTTVGETTKGDWIAVRSAGGGGDAQVGQITDIRSLMGGRVREVTMVDSNGNESKRILTPDTAAFLLPDLPDTTPGGRDGDGTGPVDISEVRRNDVIMVRDPIRGGMAEVKVSTVGQVDGSYSIQGVRTVDNTPIGVQVDAGTSVGRVEAAGGKAITPGEVKAGDQIDYVNGKMVVAGFVTKVEKSRYVDLTPEGEEVAGVQISVITDPNTGAVRKLDLFPTDTGSLVLVARDEDAARRVEADRAKRARQVITRDVQDKMDSAAVSAQMKVSQLLLERLNDGEDIGDLEEVRAYVKNNGSFQSSLSVSRSMATGRMAVLFDDDMPYTERRKAFNTFDEPYAEVQRKAVDLAIRSIVEATPLPGRSESASRAEVAYNLASPARTYNGPSHEAAADSIAAGIVNLNNAYKEGVARASGGASGAGVEAPAAVPDETPVEAVNRARSFINGTFGFNSVERPGFAPVTLAELEAGKVPEIVTVTVDKVDVAEDDGPGHRTMAQLAVVKQAGAVVRADVDRRAAEILANQPTGQDFNEEVRTAAQKAQDARSAWQAANKAEVDRLMLSRLGMSYEDAQREKYRLQEEYYQARRRRDSSASRKASLAKTKLVKQIGQAGIDAGKTPEVTRLDRDYQDAVRQQRELEARRHRVENAALFARIEARKAVLSELRTLGGPGMEYDRDDDDDHVQALRWAETHYPKEWLEAAKTKPGVPLKVKSVGRGYYAHYNNEIALSGYGREGSQRVAVHELGHRMEYTVPGLKEAERAYLWSRTTKRGEIGNRRLEGLQSLGGMMSAEKTRRDQFKNAYSGKDYKDQAYEVFTTGVESLFAGSDYLDDDYEEFMLGVMAVL